MDLEPKKIRIRCQVLQTIAAIGPCTSYDIQKHLPHLDVTQVTKACYRLMEDDEIFKTALEKRGGNAGRPRWIYEVIERDNWEPPKKKTAKRKSGRKSHSQELRTAPRMDYFKDSAPSMRPIIHFRDRKIRLLKSYLKTATGTNKDLLIGMIEDYKVI